MQRSTADVVQSNEDAIIFSYDVDLQEIEQKIENKPTSVIMRR